MAENTELRIELGTPVIYQGSDGFEAERVTQIKGDFLHLGTEEPYWIPRSAVVAVGVYTDNPEFDLIVDKGD